MPLALIDTLFKDGMIIFILLLHTEKGLRNENQMVENPALVSDRQLPRGDLLQRLPVVLRRWRRWAALQPGSRNLLRASRQTQAIRHRSLDRHGWSVNLPGHNRDSPQEKSTMIQPG